MTDQQIKGADEMYCANCGAVISNKAIVCTHCGVPTANYRAAKSGGKSKTVAILLAIFLDQFTYLYTYNEDKGKFWFYLIGNLIAIPLSAIYIGLIWYFVTYIIILVDIAGRPSAFYTDYDDND